MITSNKQVLIKTTLLPQNYKFYNLPISTRMFSGKCKVINFAKTCIINKMRYIIFPENYGINFAKENNIDIYKDNRLKKIIGCVGKYQINTEPYEHQLSQINYILTEFKNKNGLIIQRPTGSGKTYIAIYCFTKLNMKTLIVVPTLELQKQWVEELNNFIIGSINISIDKNNLDADIIILVVNSVTKINNFRVDLIIFDEVHRYQTEEFSKVFTTVKTVKMLAISATINRDDGFEKVLKWYISDDINIVKNTYSGKIPHVKFIKYKTSLHNIIDRNGLNFAKMQTQLYNEEPRINLIVDEIRKIISLRNQILILVLQIETVDLLAEKLKDLGTIGKIYSKDQVINYKDMKIIIATRSSGGTGINIKNLDTLFITLTINPHEYGYSFQQIIGRIMRKNHKKPPLILDINDIPENEKATKIFMKNANKRRLYYKENNFIIE